MRTKAKGKSRSHNRVPGSLFNLLDSPGVAGWTLHHRAWQRLGSSFSGPHRPTASGTLGSSVCRLKITRVPTHGKQKDGTVHMWGLRPSLQMPPVFPACTTSRDHSGALPGGQGAREVEPRLVWVGRGKSGPELTAGLCLPAQGHGQPSRHVSGLQTTHLARPLHTEAKGQWTQKTERQGTHHEIQPSVP